MSRTRLRLRPARWRSRAALLASTRTLLTIAAIVGWVVFLRPTALGGPASYLVISGGSMKPTLDSGDMVIARARPSYQAGDVVVYRVPAGEPASGARVIHRIVGGSASLGYRTRGDNRRGADRWRPRPADIDGAQWLRLPWVGRIPVILGTPMALAVLSALLAFLFVGAPRRRTPVSVTRPDSARPAPSSAQADTQESFAVVDGLDRCCMGSSIASASPRRPSTDSTSAVGPPIA